MEIPYIVFTNASAIFDDSGELEYNPIGPIAISPYHIVAYLDHTIRTTIARFTVMETFDQIRAKLKEG